MGGDVGRIDLTQDMSKLWAFVNGVIVLWVP